MTHDPDEGLKHLLREALPPASDDTPVDLWPRMHRRLGELQESPARVEWLLAAAVTVLCLLRTDLVNVFFFHF